mgnify:CR=1 FL=1
MAVPVAALAKIAAAALSDEDTRRKLGWIVAAICSPLILTLALICSLLSGSAEHNNSAVLLCFNGGTIPDKTPAEYVAYIEDMRRSFALLDSAIATINDMMENSDSTSFAGRKIELPTLGDSGAVALPTLVAAL